MASMTHENVSGTHDMIEESHVMIECEGHLDFQSGKERHDLEEDDFIHTLQYGDNESHILGIPLIDLVVEPDVSIRNILHKLDYSDVDASLVFRDGNMTYMDISV